METDGNNNNGKGRTKSIKNSNSSEVKAVKNGNNFITRKFFFLILYLFELDFIVNKRMEPHMTRGIRFTEFTSSSTSN